MWRPGAPAPGGAASKKKKKKKKSSGPAAPASARRGVADGRGASGGTHGGKRGGGAAGTPGSAKTPTPAAKRDRSSAGKQNETQQHADDRVLELDSRPVMPGTRPERMEEVAKKPAKTELSAGLRGLRFMQRKEEEGEAARAEADRLRKLREEKWVIDPALLQSHTGKLVCEPLLVAPRRAAGRRSFGAFNQTLENSLAQSERDAAASKRMLKLEADAIGSDEMAEFLGDGKRRSPAAASSTSAKGAKRRRKA
ncbi:Hypothetical Protein FCC1311_038952 [Hondaea fermentalgiana]|uniref:Uncharacterized protein n=1 Tax=Hondaea fermentalgiana TaxID=2315210 RepID=A0A2R5G9D6_9STRA|nr:Hypothetical Protein FCC1311_038952 [Hondaea fermentalgiana]|eukprot:GBG27672.1 Hypothetical Protein FCC1311_038952 [Hondaea fermentalgiana]